jgi:hypothetical protein
MADECIHGFEGVLCDICFPRVQPEPKKVVRTPPGGRKPSVRAAGAPTIASYTLATQRFFHVTHLRNLEAIVHEGQLRADAEPIVDVSSAVTRELRAGADLADGSTVAQHVSFYVSPTAERWVELRDGAVGPHWSDAARAAKSTEFVLLAVPATVLGDGIVAADNDAAAPATRFAVGAAEATQLLRRLPDFLNAEILVPHSVAFEDVAMVGVANDRVRDEVRDLLGSTEGFSPKVSVYPPWFTQE